MLILTILLQICFAICTFVLFIGYKLPVCVLREIWATNVLNQNYNIGHGFEHKQCTCALVQFLSHLAMEMFLKSCRTMM